MRAAVLRDGRMVYRDDVPEPIPETGQVLVGVRACGICGSTCISPPTAPRCFR